MATQYVPIGGGGANFDAIYPVGAIYLSTNATSPDILFGVGHWTRIADKFLLCGMTTYTPGGTGGAVKLVADNLPNHTHNCSNPGNHNHDNYAIASNYGGSRCTYGFASEGGSGSYRYSVWGMGAGGHSHTVDGGGKETPDDFLPPYMSVYAWYRDT